MCLKIPYATNLVLLYGVVNIVSLVVDVLVWR